MSVVVEQTIPFSQSALNLGNPNRWNALFPLIKPSFATIHTDSGSTVLVDQSCISSKDVHLAVVSRPGNFSSKLLDTKNVTAIATEQQGYPSPTTKDIRQAIKQAGVTTQEIVILRSMGERRVESHSPGVVEVVTDSDLELDHMIHLLSNANASCRASLRQTTELIEIFQRNASITHSRFALEKVAGKPAVVHADGAKAFEKASHAIEKDFKHVVGAQSAQHESAVYSVHFSDVNGLSCLENYILAAQIGQLLGKERNDVETMLIVAEEQELPYKLSHSTLLDHAELARGFAISICAIPSHYLSAQSKAGRAQTIASQPNHTQPTTAAMTFSDAQFRQCIVAGCKAVIKAEPTITEYDTIVGDGDCGYTLRDGANQVLQFIKNKDLARLPQVVGSLVHDLEINMGGTSGALYCIFLTALASSLSTEATVPTALQTALKELMNYTRARLGDRTMMDALIPFVDTLEATHDVQAALHKAREGVDATKKMTAQLGRSSYLDESATQGVPDPGAYGLLVLLEGMSSVTESA